MQNDFSKGSIKQNMIRLAVPMTMAQLINVLYNVVDRMYIGRLPEHATLSLTGMGLSMPIITIIIGFANLFGTGGAPLCSIARGKGDMEEAEAIMGNAFTMLLSSGMIIMLIGILCKQPLLYLFGASDATYPFANEYLTVYLCGTIFVMIELGLNSYINAQGFARIGMLTVLIGAVANIILDPVFIFVFHMGIKGAALASVISQFLSAVWTLQFLLGRKTLLKITWKSMHCRLKRVTDIVMLGLSGFVMQVTNSIVTVVCNATLQGYGGDLYVGVMTIISSIREVIMMPVHGITGSAQPIMGFNYGAKQYKRVLECVKFMSILLIGFTCLAWGSIHLFPNVFIGIFSQEDALIAATIPSIRIYYFGFCFMALQFAGQTTFQSLGKSKQAIFFSIFRKIVIVVPLTLILPRYMGVNGVFWAEPISNLIGGSAAFFTMLAMVVPEMKRGMNN
ncbi:MAG: MATE family efflux transporter [Lachnospiraceae bacterium]|nr:MATE family efflux transporter [Lachnospiraceae bacterium]